MKHFNYIAEEDIHKGDLYKVDILLAAIITAVTIITNQL